MEKQDWRKKLGESLTKLGVQILFIDANGRIGEVWSPATGSSSADCPGSKGAMFREALCESDMVSSATFSVSGSPPTPTLTHKELTAGSVPLLFISLGTPLSMRIGSGMTSLEIATPPIGSVFL